MFKNLLIPMTLLLTSLNASAELVMTDWKTTNDQQAVLDTKSGKEWITLENTGGENLTSITARLNSDLAGWRLPTIEETLALFTNNLDHINRHISLGADHTMVGNASLTEEEKAQVSGMANALRPTGFYAYGVTLDPTSGTHRLFGIDEAASWSYINFGNYANITSPYYSVYLVSDGGTTLSSQLDSSINIAQGEGFTDVTGPLGAGILGLSLFVVGAKRRKN